MNQEADCIKSSVQEVTQDQAEVIEHSGIYESNLPTIEQENLQHSNKELSKDVCIIQRVAGHDVEFLIPETYFQKTEGRPLSTWLLVLEKISKHEIYNIYSEVESILSSLQLVISQLQDDFSLK